MSTDQFNPGNQVPPIPTPDSHRHGYEPNQEQHYQQKHTRAPQESQQYQQPYNRQYASPQGQYPGHNATYGQPPVNPYMPAPQQNAGNPLGTTGFVLAIISIFTGWIPYVGWLVWLLALIFSAIGVTRRPRGLATAGLIIAIGLLLLLIVLIAIIGLAAFSTLTYLD